MSATITSQYDTRHVVIEFLPDVMAPTATTSEPHRRARVACGMNIVERTVDHAGPVAQCRPCYRVAGNA